MLSPMPLEESRGKYLAILLGGNGDDRDGLGDNPINKIACRVDDMTCEPDLNTTVQQELF